MPPEEFFDLNSEIKGSKNVLNKLLGENVTFKVKEAQSARHPLWN